MDEGVWGSDQSKLKEMALTFYRSPFTFDNLVGERFLLERFPLLEANKLQSLDNACTKEEVLKVLKEISPYKAPGPNGFQAAFLKKTWDITGLGDGCAT